MVQNNPYINLIPSKYVSAILKIHEEIGQNALWALGGDLAEALQSVRVEPDCIEILTSKEGAEKIHAAVEQFDPQQITYQVQELAQKALIEGKEYPVYTRSYYFEFFVDGIKAKVEGDLQFRVGNWEWGDTFEFVPYIVYIVNKRTSVVPLYVNYELYQRLGWADRVDKITWVIANRRHCCNHMSSALSTIKPSIMHIK
jgi:hypothetical protein